MLTYQRETLKQCLEDMQELWPEHFREVASFPDRVLNVNIDRLRNAENAKALVIVTARDDGKMVGYMMDILINPMHYKNMLMASSDAFYIKPEYRAKCARGLLKLIEKEVRSEGAEVRVTRVKFVNNAEQFHALMGYKTFEINMKKELQNGE
jgi:Acetyltransferase (GNAT) domain